MRNKVSNVLWGLFFVAIAIGLAGNAFELWDFKLFFKGWWTLFIIIPCFIGMVQNGLGSGSTIGFIIGVMLLMSYYVEVNVFNLILPAIFLFIGLRLIFRDLFKKRRDYSDQSHVHVEGNTHADSEYTAVFSSNQVNYKNQSFNGTSLSAIFGAVTLDLRDAIIDRDVDINATAVFGGIDIYTPRGVQVKVNNIPIFGGVSNKSGKYSEPGAPTIYLNSTCMFGGIDIK